MNKSDLAKRLSRQKRLSKAQAADEVDRVVHQIILDLRKGHPAQFPGLGKFTPGEQWRFQFDSSRAAGGKRGGE